MVDRLVALIENGLSRARRDRTHLRAVEATPIPRLPDADATRDCRLKRVRWLAKAFRLDELVGHRCMHLSGPEELSDMELFELHQDMELAAAASRLPQSFVQSAH
jgi:hypothetical protein